MSILEISIPSGRQKVSSTSSILCAIVSLFDSNSSNVYSPITTRSADIVACLMTLEGLLTANTAVAGSITFQYTTPSTLILTLSRVMHI